MVLYGVMWYVWYDGVVWSYGTVCIQYEYCMYVLVLYGIFSVRMVWYGMVWYGMVWYGMVWYGMVWYDILYNGMVWYDIQGRTCQRESNSRTFKAMYQQIQALTVV
jgi:chloride channel 2